MTCREKGVQAVDMRDVASMNMDIGILRGLSMKVEESDVFDLMVCALDGLEEIAERMLDEVEGRMKEEPEEKMNLDLKRLEDDGK